MRRVWQLYDKHFIMYPKNELQQSSLDWQYYDTTVSTFLFEYFFATKNVAIEYSVIQITN